MPENCLATPYRRTKRHGSSLSTICAGKLANANACDGGDFSAADRYTQVLLAETEVEVTS
jgi:hypothetical protein